MVDLIEANLWDAVYHEFELHPELAREVHNPSRLGWTKLHWLCSMGSAPPALLDLVARANPNAITLADARFGDTCLHIVCRNSQTSSEKVRILLQHLLSKDAVLLRNYFGGTALHSAANHNATLETLQLLVEANPSVLKATTRDGLYALSALWHAYMQTIPGYMTIARLLHDPTSVQDDAPFERFWSKVMYLATESYWYTLLTAPIPYRSNHNSPLQSSPRPIRPTDATMASGIVLHGLLQCNVVFQFFKVALAKCPSLAGNPDHQGNLPLHRLIQDRPYRLKEREAISVCLRAYPDAATQTNNAGEYPLWMAIHNKIPWHNGIDLLVQTQAHVLNQRDPNTKLVAYQMAASHGGKVAIETCFCLLVAKPDLIKPWTQRIESAASSSRR